MTSFEIRPAKSADLPELMGLDHSSSSDHVWQLDVRHEPRGAEVSATFREVRLPRAVPLAYPHDPFRLADDWKKRALFSCAIAEAQAIGYVSLEESRSGLAWITDLVVTPPRRRQGVASGLLQSAHRWCEARGHARTFMEMQSKNYPAIMLAQKIGYEFCGYNDHYYSNQDIALVFVRALQGTVRGG
jgi:GNAT superfamily N-acetyltransferase